MLPVSVTPDVPLQPMRIGPRECYDKNGYSKTKAFLYQVAYTPSFSLPSDAQSIRLHHDVQLIFTGLSLLIMISIIPCPTCLKKLAPRINKIIPIKWIESVLKCTICVSMVIVCLAVASVYGLLMQKKRRIVLETIIAVKTLADLYLRLSKPTAQEHADHLQKSAEEAATTTESAKELFKTFIKIKQYNEKEKQVIRSTYISIVLKKFIILNNNNTDNTEKYVEKIRNTLIYVTAHLENSTYSLKDPKYIFLDRSWFLKYLLDSKIPPLRKLCAKHIYEHTKNPVLTLSVLQNKESHMIIEGNNLKEIHFFILLKEVPLYSFLFEHAQIQLEECRSKIRIGPPEEKYVLSSMLKWKDAAGNIPKEITTMIMDFSGHHAKPIFIETLFMQDVLSIFQDCILREHVIASGQTFDKTALRAFSNFLEKECDFENNTQQRVAIDTEMRPIDWSEKTLKARLAVLDDTVLNA